MVYKMAIELFTDVPQMMGQLLEQFFGFFANMFNGLFVLLAFIVFALSLIVYFRFFYRGFVDGDSR